MKHVEKLDLVLRELYKHRFDGRNYSILHILYEFGGEPSLEEALIIGERLDKDNLIIYAGTKSSAEGRINSYGIEYCESSSHVDNSIPISQFNYEYLLAKPGSQVSKEHVRELVTKSKLEEAIKTLRNFPNLTRNEEDVLDAQLGRLTRLTNDSYYGLITSEEKETHLNRISVALLRIINS